MNGSVSRARKKREKYREKKEKKLCVQHGCNITVDKYTNCKKHREKRKFKKKEKLWKKIKTEAII